MRRLICYDCAQKQRPQGTRKIYEGGIDGPAEYQRLTLGNAKEPQISQRWIEVNGVRQPLGVENFDCDNCGASIKAGDPCAAWTVWTEETGPIEVWESEYLQ